MAVEKSNASLKGALPDNYFSRVGLDGSKLSALIDMINNIDTVADNTSGEGTIRQKLLENDLVDCMITLPGQLFHTTQIPVCLWFLSKSQQADGECGYRNREGETLFIDARKMASMISRTQKKLFGADIAAIANRSPSKRCVSTIERYPRRG